MLFVTTGTHERVKSHLRQALFDRDQSIREHNTLTLRWNALVAKLNKAGGEAFVEGNAPHKNPNYYGGQSNQFTDSELRSILQMIHPDKQNGSAISVTLAQKINQLRK